jgi:hypothetical protein
MAIVYGSDIAALTDLPDPEVIVSEEACAAYACARRWLTPDGALQDIGETEQYDSIDVTEWLGDDIDLNDPTVINDLEAQATQVLLDEPYAKGGATVVATYAGGTLTLTGNVAGASGPFSLVVSNGAAGVTASLLLPGQVQTS